MDIFTDPREQMARIGYDALCLIRHRLEHEESPPREELLKIVKVPIKEIEDINLNAEYHAYFLCCKE